jgi:hypothetical protein
LKNHLRLAVPPVLLAFTGCAAEYGKTEAPAQLRVDGAGSHFEGAFAGAFRRGSRRHRRSEEAHVHEQQIGRVEHGRHDDEDAESFHHGASLPMHARAFAPIAV